MEMRAGLVTTILPVYNRAAMLRDSAASVLAQTYRDFELIIIDDGSTDDTGAVADAIVAEHPDVVRVIHQRNAGVGAAREAGRLAARGEFIQHLDSDDLLYPRKFECQVAGLRAHPECGVSYGWTRSHMYDGTLSETPDKRTGERIETMFPAMLQSRWWQTITPLYRASLIHRAGAWLPLRNEEDWEYDARIAALGVRLHHCEEWLAEMRHHDRGRLSDHGMAPDILRDRARAHALILGHAQRAGIGADVPEMKRFARELFLLARQCGDAGLPDESKMLFLLAREASGPDRDRFQFRLYAAAARVFGWSLTGRIACLSDHLR
ncbi:MAG TPA: glycosyltransferase family A protein [Thermoanaerobaculia bacterium]|nr:glycosyltransferase family A protein [Thermoanaerobaculia bacterium]